MAETMKSLADLVSQLQQRISSLETEKNGSAYRTTRRSETKDGVHRYCTLRPVPERVLAPT